MQFSLLSKLLDALHRKCVENLDAPFPEMLKSAWFLALSVGKCGESGVRTLHGVARVFLRRRVL